MDSNQEFGKKRAQETFNKMKHPKMQSIQNEFIKTLNVSVPTKYRIPFIKSWNLFTKKEGIYKEILTRKGSKFNNPEKLYSLINGEIQDKIYVIYYHFQNAVDYQEIINKYCDEIINIAKEINIDWPITISLAVKKLYFEYESFILQCKSCFERVILSISYYYKSKAYKIKSLNNILRDISGKARARNIRDIINKPWNFYDVLKSRGRINPSERDIIAHKGIVSIRPLNIIINPKKRSKVLLIAKHNDEKDSFHLPSLINSMNELMEDFLQFIIEIYDIFFS